VITELVLTVDPIIAPSEASADHGSGGVGAIITFQGIVRGLEASEPIAGLDYSAFEAMARHQFALLFETASQRWPITSVRLIHRLGPIAVGEVSLWIQVAGPHRGEAFAACQWLIDQMKAVVPIWKKPYRE